MPAPRIMSQIVDVPSASNFMSGALGFTKNPLGIIGLFVVLIYGLAVVVAGFSPELTNLQRWVMIALVASFPPCVLWTFYRLVTKHHAKLYAPADWRNEENFLRAMSTTERRQELRAEARMVVSAEADEAAAIPAKVPSGFEERRKLLSQLNEAKDLALDALEKRFELRIFRDVTSGDAGYRFDGVSFDIGAGVTNIYEVKLIRVESATSKILSGAIATVPDKVRAVAEKFPNDKISITLVIVTLGLLKPVQERLAEWAEERLTANAEDALVVVFDLQELREGELPVI